MEHVAFQTIMPKLNLASLILLLLCSATTGAFAQGSAFTYQGRLINNGTSAHGNYDLRFILYTADVGGSQIGPVLTNSAVAVNNGLFIATLEFGAGSFPGSPRFLEIAVRTNGVGAGFSSLSPRQPVTSTPYAMTAGNVTGTGLAALTATRLRSTMPAIVSAAMAQG